MTTNILDLSFTNLSSIIVSTVSNINSENHIISYLEQSQHLEFEGESSITILGLSFTMYPSMADTLSPEYESLQQKYLDAQEEIFKQILNAIENLFKDITEPRFKPEQITPTESCHKTWITPDNDRLTLDLADDSLIITLYLSGQY